MTTLRQPDKVAVLASDPGVSGEALISQGPTKVPLWSHRKHFMVQHKTADYTITRQESGTLFTNLGAGATITLNLPQNAIKGDCFYFVVLAVQQLRIDAGAAGAIYINGVKSADNAYIWADDEGESVLLVCDGNNDWAALFTQGTWTVV